MRVLVIQTAFIGDAILSTCILEALHQEKEVDHITYMVRKGNESLFEGHPFLDEVLVLDKSLPKWKEVIRLLRKIRRSEYDVVVNVQRFATTGLLTALSGADVKIGYDKNPLSWAFTHKAPHSIGDGRHEVERCMELLRPVFGKYEARPRLYTSEEQRISVKHPRPYVTMAPSSVWFTKQWPKEQWIALIRALPEDLDIMLIGGPGDRDLAESIRESIKGRNVLNRCGELGLLTSTALIEGAVMNYANDSAPMHLATSVDAPVTAIYCSTLPSFGFGPLSSAHLVMETEEKLPCRPCGLHGKKSCPEGHFRCSQIDIEQLVSKSLALMEKEL